MIEETTTNRNYPLPHPENRASQDVERIATAIQMIDGDLERCISFVEGAEAIADKLDKRSLRIPEEFTGVMDTEVKGITARCYLVVNEDATGFKTVEGGGGEGGLRGEILVKRSEKNFDTMWVDPRSVLKQAPVVKDVASDTQLSENCSIILADVRETETEHTGLGLTLRQIDNDVIADSFYTYILCDEIDETIEDVSDIASAEKFGRVKIGSGINVDNGTISVPIIGLASEEEFGLVKIGDWLAVDNGVISTLPYQHADHENFGIIKPSSDFEFGSDGSLQLAMRNESIIYQAGAIEIVKDGIIKVVPNRIHYRAFINTDTLFSFDFGDFVPESDIAFELEIVSEGNYVINFGSAVVWELPCAGVNRGTTVIAFRKVMGEGNLRGSLKSVELNTAKLLTKNSENDVNDDYICGHNGCGWRACECLKVRESNNGMSFKNPIEGIWYVDFVRSTYVDYLEYVNGVEDWEATYFYIEGSVDGENWTRLLTRENVKPTTYVLDRHGFFKHYRIRCGHTQFCYFRWFGYDVDDDLYELQRVVPIMSSDSENGYKIFSSGVWEGSLYNLTNETDTWVDFDTADGTYWVKYELPEAKSVDMIDLAARFGAESDRMPTWFKIEGSNDDENWDLILERASLTQWYEGENRYYWINNETPYKFYKLTSIEQPVSLCSISRFRLFQKIEGTNSTFIPKLTNTIEGGYEIKVSSDCGGGHEPVNAFDGNKDTKWATSNGGAVGGWIQVKFPAETVCTKVWLRARNDNWYGQAPTSFTISASNDGVSFAVVKTVTNESWEQGEQKEYEFDLEEPKLYYRVTAQAVQNGEGYFALSQLNFGKRERAYKRDLEIKQAIVPVMTSNEQDGVIVTASSIYSGAKVYNPFEAFNRSISDFSSWSCDGQEGWIQVELPEAKSPNQLTMSGGYSDEEPDSFILCGSNDGENFEEILNSGDLEWTHNETKKWDLECMIPYKFFRVEAKNQKTNYITISEIGLYEIKTTREY